MYHLRMFKVLQFFFGLIGLRKNLIQISVLEWVSFPLFFFSNNQSTSLTFPSPFRIIISALYRFVIEGNRLPLPGDIPERLAHITKSSWKQVPDERPSFQEISHALAEFLAAMK